MKTTLKTVLAGFIAGFAGAFTFYNHFVKPHLDQTQAKGGDL